MRKPINTKCGGVLAAAGLLVALAVGTAFAIDSQSATWTHLRDQATASGSSVTFWRGDTFIATNCSVLNSTTNGGPNQDLTGHVVTSVVGNANASIAYECTVTDTAGVYSVEFPIPTNGTVYVQTTVTESATSNTYTYGWKLLSVKDKL